MSSFTAILLFIFGLISISSSGQAAGAAHAFPGAQQVRSGGSYLGLGLRDVDAERAKTLNLDTERGAEVMRVQDESAAEKAGFKPGDVLLTYNGEMVLGAQQVGRLVWETPVGRHVKIQYWRDGKVQTTTIVTGTPPPPGVDLNPDFGRISDRIQQFRNAMPTDIPSPLLVWKNQALGVECEPLESQLADFFGVRRGVLVRFVEKGSGADKAGLRSGDVITAAGNHPLSTPRELTQYLRNQPPNTSVQIAVVRDHKRLTISFTPAAAPE